MDNKDLRSRSSEPDTSNDVANVQERFGDRWPFPINGELKPWTAKQRKFYKAKEIQDAEEALL